MQPTAGRGRGLAFESSRPDRCVALHQWQLRPDYAYAPQSITLRPARAAILPLPFHSATHPGGSFRRELRDQVFGAAHLPRPIDAIRHNEKGLRTTYSACAQWSKSLPFRSFLPRMLVCDPEPVNPIAPLTSNVDPRISPPNSRAAANSPSFLAAAMDGASEPSRPAARTELTQAKLWDNSTNGVASARHAAPNIALPRFPPGRIAASLPEAGEQPVCQGQSLVGCFW